MKKVLLTVLYILNAAILSAQDTAWGSSEKQGFLIGAGIGGGALLAKDTGIDMKNYGKYSLLNLKLGWMITPRTAICLHVPSGGHTENGETRAFEAVLVTGQHWFSKKIWGTAGLGLAMDMPPFYDTDNDDPEFYFGTALSAGMGYEILQKESFVLEIQARCLHGNYDVEAVERQSVAFDILVGVNRY